MGRVADEGSRWWSPLLSARQQHAAEAFAVYAYRLRSVMNSGMSPSNTSGRARHSADGENVLRVSQKMEGDADRFGFDAEIKSIPGPTSSSMPWLDACISCTRLNCFGQGSCCSRRSSTSRVGKPH